ncbi:recombinase family protein [Anaerovorax odorimutans]|uniref:recombinase family protein n=1 Tax=Anaerovorax odorimutans TaxID=109327 RepID=UPI0004111924|nr:recombinase family protein [Anaerovorax odorimutans]
MIAIYSRQSVDKKDSISIDTQINFCIKTIEDGEAYKIYTDKGYSGGNTHRPAFEKMIKDFESGIYTKLVVYKVDRISRSILDFADIIGTLEKFKVKFASATETFDTSTPIGRAMLHIIMVFAQLERETIQTRITHNYYARAKKGYYMGGPPPYGFKKIYVSVEGHKTSMYSPDEVQLPNLLKMYDLYLSNMSLGDIAKSFNDQGIKTGKGGNWESSKISRILNNPSYVKADAEVYTYYNNKGVKIENGISEFVGQKGCFLYGKRKRSERKYTRLDDHVLSIALHDGVIDSNSWLRCQEKLNSNVQIGNAGKGKHSWLSGIIKCGYCGYSLVVVVTKKKYKKFYCSGHRSYNACNDFLEGKNVEEIEEAVRSQIFDRINEMNNTKYSLENTDTALINNIKLKIIAVEKQIEHIVTQICNGGETLTRLLNDKAENLMEEKELLEKELQKEMVDARTGYYDDIRKCIDNWDKSSMEQKKAVARDMIKQITVKNETISIEWKV